MQLNKPRSLLQSRKLAVLIVVSALGGIASVLIGYAGSLMGTIPVGSFISGQLLAGLHVFWPILALVITRTKGAATFVGSVKGLIEMILPNHLGPLVFFISFLEGLIVDLALSPFRKVNPMIIYVVGGLSAASNILILQTFLLPNLSIIVYEGMYLAAFLSGSVLGGYLSIKTLDSVNHLLPTIEFNQE